MATYSSQESCSSASGSTLMDEDEENLLRADQIEDPVARRRAQNRNAQRNYREKQRRRLAELEQRLAETPTHAYPDMLGSSCNEYLQHLRDQPASDQSSWFIEPSYPISGNMECRTSPSATNSPILPVASWLEATRPIQDVQQFHARHMMIILNALEIHLRHLDIPHSQVVDKRSVSPYVVRSNGPRNDYHDVSLEQRIAYIRQHMPYLAPEDLQRTVKHHPYIDLIPFPGFRQSILEILRDSPRSINQAELCHDIEMGGLRLWGQCSFDPRCYELTEEFAAKWGYLFLRDKEALYATNMFRKERGIPALGPEQFGAGHSHGRSEIRFGELQLIHILGNEL